MRLGVTVRRWPGRRWTARSTVLVLVASLLPVVVMPAAPAAAGPSVPLPQVGSVPVQPQAHRTRDSDAASRSALKHDQLPRTDKAGSGMPTATPLSPSATWQVSPHSGDFTWSYPLRVPPVPGGLEPTLALSYRSSAVDGRTSATNNQPSWIGDGWELSPGYIDRTYLPCSEDDEGDAKPDSGDLCWRSDNAVATYAGGGGMLICCDDKGLWHAKSDDGSRIERLRNVDLRDGDQDGEYWRITTIDGTQYLFGSQKDAHSTWTVPVFGDDSGEPCNQPGSFDASHCRQAWRWNLDKVIDRNGNVIRYFYDTESNSYGRNGSTAASYVRGGTLHHIEYGLHERVAGGATGRVEFTTANRCVPGSTCTPERTENWPDTAWDRKCDTPTCTTRSPSFWSTKRLDTITSKVLRGSAYDDVDQWRLEHQFPDPGDGSKAALWLRSITHIGVAGDGRIELEPVTFEGTQFPNRVDSPTDGYAQLIRYRITGVVSETGGATSVTYAAPDCVAGQSRDAESNTGRCFPVRWAPPGHEPRTDYFHKYVVGSVMQSDMLASSAEQVVSYEYLDGAAWHFDTSEFVPEEKKTWNEFHGFKRVRVRGGAPNDPGGSPMTMTEHRFYQGMHGDKRRAGPYAATVTDSAGDAGSVREDFEWLQGIGFETTTFANEAPSNAPDPPIVSRTITYPTWGKPTATRDKYKAYVVGTGTQRVFVALKSGGWRETKSVTTYNDHGLPTSIDDLGDVTTAADDRCSTTTFAGDVPTWHLDRPGRVETVAVACGATPRFPEHAISDYTFGYDARGNLTRTEIAKERLPDKPIYITTASATYDEHGRVVEARNARGKASTVGYTPRTGGPVTGIETTSASTPTLPTGLVTRTELNPAFGVQTKATDVNGRVTEIAYDALGRAVEAWLPNRSRSKYPDAGSVKYTYLLRRNAPSVVTATAIGPNGIAVSTSTLYDGLLRPRQQQQAAVGMRLVPGEERWVPFDDGRLIVDTRYDTHGRAYLTTQPYFNDAAVDTNRFYSAADSSLRGATRTSFDGAGRPIASTYEFGNTTKWTVSTAYDGDRVHTTPVAGGTATTALVDARGQTTELHQYHAGAVGGTYDTTSYRYTNAGQLAQVTGPDGAVWRYSYDLRGRKIVSTDPDSGSSEMTYDDTDRLVSAKDALGRVLVTLYDDLDRPLEVRENGENGTKLAQWTYDTVPSGKGLSATATRFVDQQPYTTSVDAYSALNQPLQASLTIPPVEKELAGTYSTVFTYGPDGTLATERYPAVPRAGVGAQTVSHEYDDWGRPTNTRTGTGVPLVASTYYTRYGEVERLEQGGVGKRTWQSFYYHSSTRRLIRSVVDAEVPEPRQSDLHYTYDPAGSITSIADIIPDEPVADIQCFRQDHVRRLTDAWTPAAAQWDETRGCTAEPSAAGLSGPAPYWHSYTYAPGGNRLREIQRTSTTTTTRTYTYPASGQPQPHTVRSVTSAAGTETYGYNEKGQNTTRFTAGSNQTLDWDREGRLAFVNGTDGTTSFIYAADGTRLLRKDPTGTTLYLGPQELRLAKGSSRPTLTRYYKHAGMTVATQTGNDTVSWLAADHQGTTQVVIDAATQTTTRRRQLPFGAPRGDTVTWPNERGFVGGTLDPSTGLTHLGAREYDPALGRFLTPDPIVDHTNPQQLNGYAYANNNPVTYSDPSGLYFIGGEDDQGNQYGISYMGGSTTIIGSRKAVNGVGTSRGTGGGTSGNSGSPGRSNSWEQTGRIYSNGLLCQNLFGSGSYGGTCARYAGSAHFEGLIVMDAVKPYSEAFTEMWNFVANIIAPSAVPCTEKGNPVACVMAGVELVLFALTSGATGPANVGRSGGSGPRPGVRGCNSFDGDTPVLMADGQGKPIDEVKVGDEVKATDPATGRTATKRVTGLHLNLDTELADVTVTGGRGNTSTVHTTQHHLFWNRTAGTWTTAAALRPGEQLVTPDGVATVVSVRSFTSAHPMYDLTVQDIHTFYVNAGKTPVLVHNCSDLALGYRNQGTAEFATKHNATHLLDLPHNGWQGPALNAINNPKVTLHVNMRGFSEFGTMVKNGLGKGPARAHATEEEMAWIAQAVVTGQRKWDTVKFYDHNGNRVNVPEPNWKEMDYIPKWWFDN
jgi:RHS repeat-associated protein